MPLGLASYIIAQGPILYPYTHYWWVGTADKVVHCKDCGVDVLWTEAPQLAVDFGLCAGHCRSFHSRWLPPQDGPPPGMSWW